MTSDRGLCGSFNTNLIKAAVQRMESEYKGWNEDKRVTVFCIGKKGADFFGKRAYRVGEKFVGLFNALEYSDAQRIARMLMERYRAGEFDRVEIVYNEFKSISQQRIVVEQFLPVSGEGGAAPEPADYIYEPDRQAHSCGTPSAAPAISDLAGAARVECLGAGRPHDRDGECDRERERADRLAAAAVQQGAAGVDYEGTAGDCQRC